MKKIFLSLVVLAVSFTGFAQNSIPHRICGTMENLEMLKQQDPTLEARMQQIQNFTNDYIAAHPNGDRAIITIPVVFHVVYNTAAQNISDAQCQYQIDQLNLDYALLNPDAAGTPAIFSGLKSATNLRFCLAARTPGGATTTGIERRNTTTTSFSTNDNIKHTSTGGLDAWDRNSYLNIWTGNLSGGVLGYAQFPGGAAATDGVVFKYSTIGSVAHPGTEPAYNLGRTATHEIGHWAGLYHIWGDDGTSCSGSDGIADTPNQADENYGCPSYPTSSCSNTSDMYMNYMDYTNDACMFMFSAGQAAVSNALFVSGGSRFSLASSQGCVPVTGGSCGTPVSLSTSGVTTSAATLSWAAVSGATSYNVQYKVSSASTWTTTTSTTPTKSLTGLTANTTYNFQVQAVCTTTGAYSSVASFTTLSSGGGCTDIYESNNTSTTAKPITNNGSITGLISTTSDIDWFSFTNSSSASKIKITLTNLPFDYDVKFYSPSGSLITTAQNGGTTSETIIYNTTTVGTYKIKVYPYSSSSATSCYTLTVLTSGTNFRTMQSGTVEINPVETTLNLYPNPTSNKLNVEYNSLSSENITINVYDLLGRKIYSEMNTANEGPNTYYEDFNNLDNGMYILEISNGTVATVTRFMMQK